MQVKTQLSRTLPLLALVCSGIFSGCAADDDPYYNPGPTIVYTELSNENVVKYGSIATIDLDQDGTTDFSLSVTLINTSEGVHQQFAIQSLRDSRVLLHEGEAIPYEENFVVAATQSNELISWSIESGVIFSRLESGSTANDVSWSGLWKDVSEGYLAVSIRKDEAYHYGWIKLITDKTSSQITVPGFAFDTEAGQSIKTGQTE